MAQRRASSRATHLSQKVVEAQAVESTRADQSGREAARLANRVPFRVHVEQHANAPENGEDPDEDLISGDEDEDVVVVTQQQQQQQQPTYGSHTLSVFSAMVDG